MGAPREIELKLQCEGDDLAELGRHPLLQSGEAVEPRVLISTYFDTAGHDLRAAGLTLRVRIDGDRHIQTVKADGAGAGLFDRPEWETDISGAEPDLTLLADTPVPAILADAEAPDVIAMFSTVVERSTRAVRYGASRLSAALDHGRIETPDGDVPLSELELELEDGTPGDLFALTQALAETVPLRLGSLSKSARGFSLIDGSLSRPSKATAIRLDEEATAGEAFRAIALACLRHLRLNEDVFLHTRAPEGLHQIRVALRRLRSAFSLFKPMLAADPAANHLREEIKRVTEPFGQARNLDVFLETTLPAEIVRRPEEPGLLDLRTRLEAERDRAHDTVIATLESQSWRGLILDLATWLETGPWRTGADAPLRDGSARDFAADVLDRFRRRIRKSGRHLDRLDAEARHEVRIASKKLRYGSEFFASLYAEKKAHKLHKTFVSALSDLQDHLGALNDMATAHTVLAGLVTGGDGAPVPGETVFAAGLAAGDGEADTKSLLKAAARAHEDLLEVKPFWR
ncbi:inorganic triphosphatase [Methylobacterium sp. BTF04]|uniref:CYTH and CHAD domain-containing protein n=1 Tax=Methylobacterium sp. BTF04 TaxID=2708300 RepID=UPI0013D46C01|nr:CHAD domain-containing protein [Methylobacterium sp. BTF04]NEU13734.1 inorganic triphosphatase [Methylobacterium sp. BTF04]